MFSKLKQKFEFSRNVLMLMSGITIAQAISTAVHYPMNPYVWDDEIDMVCKYL